MSLVEQASEQAQNTIPNASNHYEIARKRLTTRDRWAGLNPRDARIKRALDKLTPKVLIRLRELAFQLDDPQVSLGACKEILDRSLGKSRQTIDSNTFHTITADEHVRALVELARLSTRQPMIEQSVVDITANTTEIPTTPVGTINDGTDTVDNTGE